MDNRQEPRHRSGIEAFRRFTVVAVACVLVGVTAVAQANDGDQSVSQGSAVGPGVGGSDVFVAPDRPVRPEEGSRSDSAKQAAAKFLTEDLADETVAASGADELVVASKSTGDGNSTIVRFDYTSAGGVPLYGGQALVEVTANKKIRTVNSSTSNRPFPSELPSLTAAEATVSALEYVADARSTSVKALAAGDGELVFYDPAVLGVVGGPVKDVRLAWQLEVSDGESVRYETLIDAITGEVLLAFTKIDTAVDRKICDSHATNDDTCRASDSGPYVRGEGDAPLGDEEADNAYEFFGEFYDMLNTWFGRDGYDGDGGMMRGNVNVYEDGSPYQNAYYNGDQVVFGAGLATDDIVGHEWTHGLIDHTSRLIYYGESGAMNESIADVFGEFLDQRNNYDENAGSWRIGEDWKAIRSMSNPNSFEDPDTRLGTYWYTGDGDNAGVHINSGVGNKFAHLITAGGTHNNYSVSGLGMEKAARIIYGANLLLTSSSNYLAYGNALNQACTTLIGDHGITAGNCGQVTAATQAVNIYTDPNAPPPADAAGNTLVTATPLPTGWSVRETLYSGDSDYWSFTTSTTKDITIILDELPTDYDLKLYDPTGNLVTYSENPGTDSETITRTLPAGTYVARVYPWYTPTTETYRLTVTPPEASGPVPQSPPDPEPDPAPEPQPDPKPGPAPAGGSLPETGTGTKETPTTGGSPPVTQRPGKVKGLKVKENPRRLKVTWEEQKIGSPSYYRSQVKRKLAKNRKVKQTGWIQTNKPRIILNNKKNGAMRFKRNAQYIFKIQSVTDGVRGKMVKIRHRT